MNPYVQWVTLFWMLFSGAAMGLAYDSYRVLSGQFHFPKWCLHILDLLYWCGTAVFVFRMLYISNQGELRFYAFVGLFLGVWLYFLILSVTTQRFVVMLIKIVQYVLYLLKRLFMIFIWIPLRTMYRILIRLLSAAGALLMLIAGIILRCLLPFWKLLKWMLMPITSRIKMPQWPQKLVNSCIELWKRRL
ncbi:spore cortex biosynthesis protein YabQ [Paenibacillus sp. IHBB 10380]|uniref:spore cortex biosynthesis protein YabQ n=1 Tax=Paenibacillus sp. IHBB 10380 TaxID=1566358 RepID=UPI0005CFE0D1|nr:spore cortex biosynthesis protein YabQ [Paenibacillus sp. IHBB 10380]AJS60744.1 spore cortex biosynthesis protein YabQ [Paenibacillus sp. IHBB 10380]